MSPHDIKLAHDAGYVEMSADEIGRSDWTVCIVRLQVLLLELRGVKLLLREGRLTPRAAKARALSGKDEAKFLGKRLRELGNPYRASIMPEIEGELRTALRSAFPNASPETITEMVEEVRDY